MSLEMLKGYFYNSEGELMNWYVGYGDLDNMEDLLLYKYPCVGFVNSKSVDVNLYKYDFENNALVMR